MKTTHFTVPRQRRGFTFAEVLIVVAILAIVASLAITGDSRPDRTQLRAAARLLVADLEYAQMQSVGNGSDPCVIVFGDANSSYYLARLSDANTPIDDPGTGLPMRTTFGEGRAAGLSRVSFDAINVGGDKQLAFTSTGAPDQATDAVITLRAGAETITIRVDGATGEPSIE